MKLLVAGFFFVKIIFVKITFFSSGGLLTPVQTPTALTSGSSITADQNRPTKLQLVPPPPNCGTLTPESSPLGVLSPAATNAAVNMVMNSMKRPFVLAGLPGIIEEEPEKKRHREGSENGLATGESNRQDSSH